MLLKVELNIVILTQTKSHEQNSYKEHKYITSQTLRFHNTPKGKKSCNPCRYSNVLKLYSSVKKKFWENVQLS